MKFFKLKKNYAFLQLKSKQRSEKVIVLKSFFARQKSKMSREGRLKGQI